MRGVVVAFEISKCAEKYIANQVGIRLIIFLNISI